MENGKPSRTPILRRKPIACRDASLWGWLETLDLTRSEMFDHHVHLQPLLMNVTNPDQALGRLEALKYLDMLRQYIEWLRNQTYTVTISNATTDIFSDVVWAYQTVSVPVVVEAHYNVAPGNAAVFQYKPCLDMRSYAFAVYVAGVEVIRFHTMTVGQINTKEQQAQGAFMMCEDSWIIEERPV